jgi:hypothetical protein
VSEATAIRGASIGLGGVTTNRHIPALRRCAQTRLVGVIDHQPDRAERVARKMQLPLSATAHSAAEVSWLDQVDAVTIGTPPQTHFSLVRSYLEAGKHVLVEKPMAMTVAEADELVALAAEGDRVLAVVHNFLVDLWSEGRVTDEGLLGGSETLRSAASKLLFRRSPAGPIGLAGISNPPQWNHTTRSSVIVTVSNLTDRPQAARVFWYLARSHDQQPWTDAVVEGTPITLTLGPWASTAVVVEADQITPAGRWDLSAWVPLPDGGG